MIDAQDYAAVVQLLARYCHLVDGEAWDALVDEVFASDGSMTVTGVYPTTSGPIALRELYAERMRHPVAHESTSVVVHDAGADRVSVVSKWITVRADGSCGSGVYADELVRTSAGWRIGARVATPDRPRTG